MNEPADNIISFESLKQREAALIAVAEEAVATYLRNYRGGEAAFWRDFAIRHTGSPHGIVRVRLVDDRA